MPPVFGSEIKITSFSLELRIFSSNRRSQYPLPRLLPFCHRHHLRRGYYLNLKQTQFQNLIEL